MNDKMREFFNIFWMHIKKHSNTNPINGTQEECEMLINDIEAILLQYKDIKPLFKFAKTCLIAHHTFLEDIAKENDND